MEHGQDKETHRLLDSAMALESTQVDLILEGMYRGFYSAPEAEDMIYDYFRKRKTDSGLESP